MKYYLLLVSVLIFCLYGHSQNNNTIFEKKLVKLRINDKKYFEKIGWFTELNKIGEKESLIVFFDYRFGIKSLGVIDRKHSDSLYFIALINENTIDSMGSLQLENIYFFQKNEFEYFRLKVSSENYGISTNNLYTHHIRFSKRMRKIKFYYTKANKIMLVATMKIR